MSNASTTVRRSRAACAVSARQEIKVTITLAGGPSPGLVTQRGCLADERLLGAQHDAVGAASDRIEVVHLRPRLVQ